MKTPEQDLFEITLTLNEAPQRVLVRIADQKTTLFRVQVDGLSSDEDESVIERDMTLIGTCFPSLFKAKCIGNLRSFLGNHPDQVRAALNAGAITFSNLLLARTVSLMVNEGLDATVAMEKATSIGHACRQWLEHTRQAAEGARRLATRL